MKDNKEEKHKDIWWLWYVFLFLLFVAILVSGVMWR